MLAASPASGVDTLTGEGLPQAMDGAEVVVDVSNAPSWGDDEVLAFFRTSAGNVARAELDAGVGHHVTLSVVGTDRLPESGYFRAKLAQEEAVRASGVPFTILRATQFFEFLGRIGDAGTDGDTVRLAPVSVQPEAADDVASALARIAVGPPVDGIVELAGPERFRLDELVARVLQANDDPRRVIADVDGRYFGASLSERSLVPQEHPIVAPTRFDDWLARTAVELTGP
jgi:uncharacterized protein YbjT (DUF2867 family)